MRRVGKLGAVLFVLWTGTVLWMVEDRTHVIQGPARNEHSAADALCPCAMYASYSPGRRRDGEEELHGGSTTQTPVESPRNESKTVDSVRNVTHPVLNYTPQLSSGSSSIPRIKNTSKIVEETKAKQLNLEAVQQKLEELEEKTLKEEALFKEQKEKIDLLIDLQRKLEERLSRRLEDKQEQNVKEKFIEEETLRQEKIAQQQLQLKQEKKSQRDSKKKVPEKVHPASVSQNPGLFDFTISNAKACREGANTDGYVDALCLVFTAPGDKLMRSRIRETWGGVKEIKGKKFVTMFLLGQKGATYQESIEKEDGEHHDIIQQNFTDSYYNLTLKTLMGLRWTSEFCPNARFMVKMDIDMFVNLYNLADRVDKAPVHNLAEGNLKDITEPIRNKNSKWYTSRDMYPKDKYPPYLNGPAYLISSDLAGPIYKESFKVRFLPWEDAYIGIIMDRLHVEPKFNSKYETYLNYENEPDTLLKIARSITFHLGEDKEKNKENIVKVWRYVQNLNNATVV
ncbi:beta-1,3-galactosyltransferase 2-like isoform X2 [Asterias amurensis]